MWLLTLAFNSGFTFFLGDLVLLWQRTRKLRKTLRTERKTNCPKLKSILLWAIGRWSVQCVRTHHMKCRNSAFEYKWVQQKDTRFSKTPSHCNPSTDPSKSGIYSELEKNLVYMLAAKDWEIFQWYITTYASVTDQSNMDNAFDLE